MPYKYKIHLPICIVNVFFALGAILGRAVAFASPVTLGTTATDLVLCTLTVEIAETCAIAKTMPFVTQPTESALAHRDSWAKSKLKYCLGLMIGLMTLYSFLDAIENVHKDSMAKDANISADAKMEQSMYSYCLLLTIFIIFCIL